MIYGQRSFYCSQSGFIWYNNFSWFATPLIPLAGIKEGGYGNELAPTRWTDIREVNVFDPRVKWYKYDSLRKRVDIPIDKL
jgi:hypothetical protein